MHGEYNVKRTYLLYNAMDSNSYGCIKSRFNCEERCGELMFRVTHVLS
jgi:hypothetical protein